MRTIVPNIIWDKAESLAEAHIEVEIPCSCRATRTPAKLVLTATGSRGVDMDPKLYCKSALDKMLVEFNARFLTLIS